MRPMASPRSSRRGGEQIDVQDGKKEEEEVKSPAKTEGKEGGGGSGSD